VSALLILTFLVLVGPLSYFFGVDSRRSSDRGWVGAVADCERWTSSASREQHVPLEGRQTRTNGCFVGSPPDLGSTEERSQEWASS
jgi:hypothetical protein